MISRLIKYQWMIYAHLLLMAFGYNTRLFFIQAVADSLYFKVIAAAWCFIPIYLLRCLYQTKLRCILIIFCYFTLNNLADELFFDPTKLGLNELIFAVLSIAHARLNRRK